MDRYVKIKQIGEGSFGKALLVRHKENGKQMVVKEIQMGRMKPKERDEARKEVAVLAQLKHPNVVAYRESFEETGKLFIVMDYCDAGDMYSKINSQRGVLINEDQVLDWFVQICLAIKHIHDRKILHRDIKSQNIFMTRAGIIKLGDFGIAKVLNSTVELARTCIGTPYYLSPEICENRPYNNKSDIWSLGCVLYEITTLKHAFEAGSMKNLVLKIIRGSYPPVNPKYSYELRNLIASLFKRNARDRPSINQVLKKPMVQRRIQKFLNESEMADEFSHTVMHGVKLQKQIIPGKGRPLPPRPVVPVKKPPTPSTPKYNPASVYGPGAVRRSNEANVKHVRKSAEVKRSAERKPNSVAAAREDLYKKKKQELIDRENRRQVAVKKNSNQYANKHKDLVEKQKVSRLNKAREEGWKNLISSLDSDEGDKRPITPKKKEAPRYPIPQPKPSAQVPQRDRGNFEQYHAFLDELEEKRKAAGAKPVVPSAPRPLPGGVPPFGGLDAAGARQGEVASARGAKAADDAKVVEEYLQRKKEAAIYKARAKGIPYGGVAASISPRPRVVKATPVSASVDQHRPSPVRKQEDDYLAKLRQIRLQNFNERRNLQARLAGKVDPKYKPEAGLGVKEEHMKKIEALRAQAEHEANKKKAELEKRRREAYEKEQRARGERPDIKPKPSPMPMTEAMRAIGVVAAKPVPQPSAIPLEEAMKAIGVVEHDSGAMLPSAAKPMIGMTAAMEAIGVGQSQDRSPLQAKKDEILKRLNSKGGKVEKPKEEERPKWGNPATPAFAMERPKWEVGKDEDLGHMKLEETASNMDATGITDIVIKHDDKDTDVSPPSARKHWGAPRGTILNALQGAELSETGESVASTESTEDPKSPVAIKGETVTFTKEGEKKESASYKAPSVGSTITIAKSGNKGTIVIKKKEAEIQESEETIQKEEANSAEQKIEENETSDDIQNNDIVSSSATKDTGSPKQTLFEKVSEEIKSDDRHDIEVEDISDEEEKEENFASKKKGLQSGKMMGLLMTTGQFDADVKMLRTCSEPDLSKLFKTLMEPPLTERGANVASSVSLIDCGVEELEDEEEEDQDDQDEDQQEIEEDISDDLKSPEGLSDEATTPDEKQETEEEEGIEEEIVEDDDDDEEDLQTLRASMMDLLEKDDPDVDSDKEETMAVKKKKKGSKKGKGKKKKTKVKDTPPTDGSGDGDSARPIVRQFSDETQQELQTMREAMRSLLQSDKPKTSKKMNTLKKQADLGCGDGPTRSPGEIVEEEDESTIIPGKETWQSDSPDDDEYFEEEDDKFSKLEETRAKLEDELGCDTFLEAYKTVQSTCKKAIHEDEDEPMEEGVKMVNKILGKDKEHMYVEILQLVMADGVFTEDND